eukprot:s3862_g6.t1
MAGVRDEQGNFLSQCAAEYPSQLATRFASTVRQLFSPGQNEYPTAPCVPRSSPPTAAQDGGGIYSVPDWSDGPRYCADKLHDLRKEWQRWLLDKHIPPRLQQHVATSGNSPLFSDEETEWLQDSFHGFSASASSSDDWDFSVLPGQPYCLSALERLSTMLGDKDTSLFPSHRQGVPTALVPISHAAIRSAPGGKTKRARAMSCEYCEGNWQGAEADPALLQELIEEEVAAGFIEEMPDIESAFARWGNERVAVGKVNIVKAPGRSARLVIDNSVCNTNQNCTVPEQFSLPSLQDIQAAFPPREDEEAVSGFSLDVKGAHVTSLVREKDRGLLGLRQQERLFFYKVCPFGHLGPLSHHIGSPA